MKLRVGHRSFTIQFTDKSTGSPVEWDWDFTNDGTVDSTLNNPAHSYGASRHLYGETDRERCLWSERFHHKTSRYVGTCCRIQRCAFLRK